MSRPWMPLYVADYLADTGHLSAAEHGAYMLLIMHYWTNGGLPDDERRLARIARMSEDEWRAARDELASFFQDGWRHARIDAELAKSEEISSKRKAAAEQRHNKSNANASANAEQVQTQSQPQSQVSSNELTNPRAKRAERGVSPEFEDFWTAYPRRPGNPKDPASREFETLRAAGVDPATIIAGATAYAAFCVGKEPQFIAQATTWLNQGRWKDDYSAAAKPLVSRPEPDRTGSIWVPAESAPWRAWRDAKGAGFLAARKKDRAGYPDGGAWLPTEYPDARKSA